MIDFNRRKLFGMGAVLIAAPAIVRISNLMAVKVLVPELEVTHYSGLEIYGRSVAEDMLPDMKLLQIELEERFAVLKSMRVDWHQKWGELAELYDHGR